MASTYTRKDSPFIWIRYKDSNGDWKGINSGYRQGHLGDRKQAEKLAKQRSLEELAAKPLKTASAKWEEWVVPWMASKWGDVSAPNSTANRYAKYFQRWLAYFYTKDTN